MRKLPFLFGFILLLSGCQKSANNEAQLKEPEVETSVSKRNCASHDVLMDQLAADPDLAVRMKRIEEFTQRAIASGETARLLANGDIEIPVVFNVLYKTTDENIPLNQLESQITVLNQDFAATNSDYNKHNPYPERKSGDIRIRFVLDTVIRKSTTKKSWLTNDDMKKSARGGINPTSPTTKLNIWVCNMGGGILGYAQFPGGNPATDGVVLDNNATGTVGSLYTRFNLGRTATHEVGHWLNLRHIWGDATCGSDLVNDTPVHNTYNTGCPPVGHLSTCAGAPLEMWMNYMDYSDDLCLYMFSKGQKDRMWATFTANGGRTSFAQ